MGPAVAIVIVNWNGWADTIECLESVLRSDYPDFRVIVCDNGSRDGSWQHLEAWAGGTLDVAVAPRHRLRALSFPPVPKPVAHRSYDRREAESTSDAWRGAERLVLIQTGANLGFAAGANVGVRHALAHRDVRYVWLLNNDTVVSPSALTHLVTRMQARPDAGMCGSTVRYYHTPDTIQALGGATYNKWLGATWHIGEGRPAGVATNGHGVEHELSYILGASMLVSRSFLEDVGLMAEDYFLFFEELDWAIRGADRYTLAWAPESVVYHKEGVGTGASSDSRRRSAKTEYYHVMNRLKLTRRFYRRALPTVYAGVVVSLVKRLAEGQWDKAKVIAKLALGLRHPPTSR
jgi:hypothetical protein